MGKLYLPILTRYLQETAWLHSEDLKVGYSDLLRQNMTWVLYKQVIKMEEWPRWGDVITLKTWPSGVDKLFCYREFEIYLKERLIGRVSTSWLVINLDSRRPVRTSQYYDNSLVDIGSMHFPELIEEKLVFSADPQTVRTQTVQLFDIDVNNHVNNACYPLWCMNYYKPEFLKHHHLAEIELQFIAEALYGEELKVTTGLLDDLTHEHLITRDDKELFKMRLKWSS
jgi:acyl-ACP thioesterase